MVETSLSSQMKASVSDFMPKFFNNAFVKGIANGKLPKSALISYTQQDNIYLEKFLVLYQQVLGAIDPQLLAVTEHDINAENGAHQVLLRVAQTDNQTIMAEKIVEKPTTKHYIKHMQKSLEQAPYLGLAAMQACPYVYVYIANQLIAEGKNNSENPFKDWIDFYQGQPGGFGEIMFNLLDQNVPEKDYPVAIEAFKVSVADELKFFEQALEFKQYPEAVTIAGTDSGGGAGMEADIKTMQTCHTFSTNVVVGVTAQNTYSVQDLFPLPRKIIDAQFASIMDDFDIKAAKTGALFDTEHVKIVAENVKKYNLKNLVVDPVMIAKGGAKLLTDDAIQTLKNDLLPLAMLVTPNLPETELLADQTVKTQVDMLNAAKKIQQMGCPNVMVKGGHGDEDVVYDFVKLEDGNEFWLESKRVDTVRTHGTGDTLSSAIVAYLAQGMDLETSIRKAHQYLETIINMPLPIGHGHGPLNHGEWSNYEI